MTVEVKQRDLQEAVLNNAISRRYETAERYWAKTHNQMEDRHERVYKFATILAGLDEAVN